MKKDWKLVCAARFAIAAFATSTLVACGTTYDVPTASDQSQAMARAMFAEEAVMGSGGSNLSPSEAGYRFNRVIRRIEPIAENFCRSQNSAGFDCDVTIKVDSEMQVPNAYQTRGPDGRPIIAFSIPLLMDARNDDEIAFILSHEYGHLIANHIGKTETQAQAGAYILGALTSAAGGQDIDTAMQIGASVGARSYSQTYELESDYIATTITRMAGYDTIRGARYFARPSGQSSGGRPSFLSTHPSNISRLALVIESSGKELQRR